MKIKCLFFEIFFPRISTQFFNIKILNSMSIEQNIYTNGGDSHLKMQANVQENLFFQL